jgi:putative phage-type endonuclease
MHLEDAAMSALDNVGLGDNPKLSTIGFTTEEEWLQLRTKGIGGSDAGAILGLNKYSSPLSVYKAKVDGIVKDLSDNANVRRGKELEEFVLEKYVQPKMREYGYVTSKPDFMIINSDYPYLRANVDGIAKSMTKPSHKTSLLIEIKCVSTFAEDAWDGPEYCGIPPYYYAQIQHYLAVTGMRAGYLVALFDRTWSVKWYQIKRDDKFIAEMLPRLKEFYEINMLMEIPPKINYALDKDDAAKAIDAHDDVTYTPTKEMQSLVEAYVQVASEIKDLEKRKDEIQSDILERHLKGQKPISGIVKFTTTKSSRFNQTRFKSDHPDMYKQYCEESESPRSTIKLK